MKTAKLIQLKERTDKAYALLVVLANDTTQSNLVRLMALDARNHVSFVMCDLERQIEKRLAHKTV